MKLKLDSSSPTDVTDTATGLVPTFTTGEAFTVCVDLCTGGVDVDPATLEKVELCIQRPPSGGGVPPDTDPLLVTKEVTALNAGECLATFQLTAAEALFVDNTAYFRIKATDSDDNSTTYGASYWCVRLTRKLAANCKSVSQQLCESGVAIVMRDGQPYYIWQDDKGDLQELSFADIVIGKFQIENCLNDPTSTIYDALSEILNQLSSDGKICFDNMPVMQEGACDITRVALADGKLVRFEEGGNRISHTAINFDNDGTDRTGKVNGFNSQTGSVIIPSQALSDAPNPAQDGVFQPPAGYIVNDSSPFLGRIEVEIVCEGFYYIRTDVSSTFDPAEFGSGGVGAKIDGTFIRNAGNGNIALKPSYTNFVGTVRDGGFTVFLTVGSHVVEFYNLHSSGSVPVGRSVGGGFVTSVEKVI